MPLEAATFTDDLDVANPTSTDTKSQGDDHLRLIKTTIKNSIKRVTRAFYIPNTVTKNVNYSVVASDDNKTIVCDTTVAFTLTLPTLVASDAGWCVYVQKSTTDVNPVWIAPPSGTLNGFTKIRRSIEHVITKVLWNGSLFVASRPSGVPIGSCVEFYGATLPNGHLWPDGTTFTAVDFVELNTVLGGNTKPDRGGRIAVCKDNIGGIDKARVTTAKSGIDGDTLKATGGLEDHTLTLAQSPAHDHGGQATGTLNFNLHQRGIDAATGPVEVPVRSDSATAGDVNWFGGANHYGGAAAPSDPRTIASAGGGTAHNNMPPSIIANYVLVAE